MSLFYCQSPIDIFSNRVSSLEQQVNNLYVTVNSYNTIVGDLATVSTTGSYNDLIDKPFPQSDIIITSSNINLDYGNDYFYTGSGGTFTLPLLDTLKKGRHYMILIKNRGTGILTITSSSANIFTVSPVSAFDLGIGDSVNVISDFYFFNVT